VRFGYSSGRASRNVVKKPIVSALSEVENRDLASPINLIGGERTSLARCGGDLREAIIEIETGLTNPTSKGAQAT
jgi:hypothetical protein